MNPLEALTTDPRRQIEPGTRVRFKFMGNSCEGIVIQRSTGKDYRDARRNAELYTIEFGPERWTTLQPWYAVLEIIETHEIIPPAPPGNVPAAAGQGETEIS